MSIIIGWIGIFFGWLMRGCYSLVGNYGIAIILFTLISKIVLFPISFWVHKNSIKMVKLMPEINHIKATYFGDKDTIAEKQGILYKREKYNPFVSIIPLLLQLLLLVGVIEVINHPMDYILQIPKETIDSLIGIVAKLAPINIEASSVQLSVIELVSNPSFAADVLSAGAQGGTTNIANVLQQIQLLNMDFLGFNLGWVPSLVLGISVIVPILAGISAWVLAFVQNRINVLQAEQGKLNKYGMMIFTVALSLVLGWYVPVGIGLYWIFSNLFAILQLVVLNIIVNPKKHVDYQALEESREELAALEASEEKTGLFTRNPHRRRERKDYKRFFSIANKHIVFYSEGSGFYKYFENIIEYLLENTNLNLHYITNDPEDAIFALAEQHEKIKPYYIGPKRLIILMMKMDAKIVVMTTPELETYHIKRSYVKDNIEYVFVFHGLASTTMVVNKRAYDHFDTLFCVGQHQIDEIRESEQLYNLPPKTLVPTGYGLIDNLLKAYGEQEDIQNTPQKILIAPSWQVDNILDLCLAEILEPLLEANYHIVVRPHPEYIKRYPARMDRLMQDYGKLQGKNFVIETDFSSNKTIFTSDLLITDWSGIAYEFSYTTKRPSLFINTPMKVLNTEYTRYENQPLDISLRDLVGVSLETDELNKIPKTVASLLEESESYKEKIESVMNQYVFNIGHSGEAGAKYLIQSLQNR